MKIDNLPPLLSLKSCSSELGLKPSRLRLIISKKRIAYVQIGSRRMIPREALPRFITENTVQPCLDETKDPACDSSTGAAATTSCGPNSAARGSAARVRQIAKSLKSRSVNSLGAEFDPVGHVIPLKSS